MSSSAAGTARSEEFLGAYGIRYWRKASHASVRSIADAELGLGLFQVAADCLFAEAECLSNARRLKTGKIRDGFGTDQ